MGSADHLARVMEERRLDLDLEWNDVAAAAKISPANLRSIRSGKTSPMPLTIRRIEKVLQWEFGSFAAVQAGGEPTVTHLEPEAQADPGDASRDLAEQLAERLRWFEEDNERRRQEDEKRMRQLEDEVKRLREQRSG